MTVDLLRQATTPTKPKPNKYEKYSFIRNPFPPEPGLKIGSPDPRENGSIYLENLRQQEQRQFEQLLIRHPDRPQVRSMSFLMDYATRRGRGIGKTSFLHHQYKRIMKDLGNALSGGTEVIFAIHVSPLPDGRSRKFWQFYKMLTQALVEQDIILNNVVERAVQGEWSTIGPEKIRQVAQAKVPREPGETDKIEPLPPTQVDLKGEA